MAVFIASRVCRGLSYAHTKRDADGRLLGIVHRDVNPKNVMLAIEGDVKLTDFGIAKALDLMYNEEGKVIPGKDEYLSPEGASYAVTDGRSDLFPLGIVLTEILLGKNLFRGATRVDSRRNILTMPIPQFSTLRADIDPKLETILHKALERDREKRYTRLTAADGDHEKVHDRIVALYEKELRARKWMEANVTTHCQTCKSPSPMLYGAHGLCSMCFFESQVRPAQSEKSS